MNFSTVSQRLADAFADREALVNIERQRRYTFREYHLLTNRIVNMMRHKLDLQRGDNAVVILDNDNASLIHWFTAVKAGTALCYTNYRDSLDDHTYQGSWGFSVLKRHNTTQPPWFLVSRGVLT